MLGRVCGCPQLLDEGEQLEPAAKASLGLIVPGQTAAERLAGGVDLERALYDGRGSHVGIVPRRACASRRRITLLFSFYPWMLGCVASACARRRRAPLPDTSSLE